MSAVKDHFNGRGYNHVFSGGVWQRDVPKWHPRYWFGYRWTLKHVYYNGSFTCKFQTDRQRARQGIDEMINPPDIYADMAAGQATQQNAEQATLGRQAKI